jgi:hypothetical protein
MIKYRQTLTVFTLLLLCGVTVAQNNTNSPYTRYGYGQLADQGPANSKGMGGVAYGMRDRLQINFANPASYTAVDSLTFIFDGGLTLQNTNFSDGTIQKNAKNSSFDYISMLFRVGRRAAVSIGMLPYANVGYTMSSVQTDSYNPANSTSTAYLGSGGFHQLYLGAGVKLLHNLSVGANVSYLWGDITHQISQSFPNTGDMLAWSQIVNLNVKSYKIDLGAQYTLRFNNRQSATLGVMFSPGHDLGNHSQVQHTMGNSISLNDTVVTMGLPTSFGAGIVYEYNHQLKVGADVLLQQWGNVSFMNKENAFSNRSRIGVGAEYIPNPLGRSYFSFIKYRLGAYFSQPYYKIDGVRAAKEYGFTAGVALPVPRNRSLVNLSFQYVRNQGTENRFLDENTFRVCVGITFNEGWFYKNRVQ